MISTTSNGNVFWNRLKTKWRGGNVFRSICLSIGGSLSRVGLCLGVFVNKTPRSHYDGRLGSAHPTGMHSC